MSYKLILIILVLFFVLAGCTSVSKEDELEIDSYFKDISVYYDRAVQHKGDDVLEVPVKLNLDVEAPRSSTYILDPGIELKIFQDNQSLAKKRIIEAGPQNLSVNPIKMKENTTIDLCIATKSFAESNHWDKTDRDRSKVSCDSYEIEKPKVEAMVENRTINISYSDVSFVGSIVYRAKSQTRIVNNGEVPVRIRLQFENGRFKVQNKENGEFWLGPSPLIPYDKVISPGNSIDAWIYYKPYHESRKEDFESVNTSAYLLVAPNSSNTTESAYHVHEVPIQVD